LGIPLTPPPSQTPATGDQANAVVTGSFTATGAGSDFSVYGVFNIAVWGTFDATAVLQKTFDGGTTWIGVLSPYTGTAVSITASGALQFAECEQGVSYRLDCSTYVSGTMNYRLSTSGLMAMSAGATSF